MSRSRISRILVVVFVLVGATGCPKSRQEIGNTLRLAHPEKVKGLDPIYADDIYAADEASRAYETLLQYHYLKRPYALVPALAESLPEISKDGKTYVLRLKKGVLFQDDPCFKESEGKGRELIASDVVYSFKRIADPKLHSTGAWLLDGKILGIREWHEEALKAEQTDYSQEVPGLKVLDRYTLQITLSQRSPSFIYALAMPFTAVVPREAVEHYGKEFQNHAVGSGAFRLAEFSQARQVWVKNPTFRGEVYPSEGEPGDREKGLLADAGKPLPLIDKLVVEVHSEWQPLWLNFLAGKLDRTFIPKDSFAQAVTPGKELTPGLKEKGIRLHKYPLLDVVHMTFNMQDPLLGKNKLLRQALSLAWDAEKYGELFFNGRVTPAQGPIPPGLSGYEPDFKNPYRQYNPAKARELLAKAGYPDGKGLPQLVYIGTADSTSRQVSEYAAQMFKQIGVKLKVETYSWPEFQTLIRNRKGQLWAYAWNADYPDVENFLQLFYGKNKSPGPNDSGYVNPEYDRLYEQVIALPEGSERQKLARQMVRMVVEDCPWVFQVHRMGFQLTSAAFANYKPSAFPHQNAKFYRLEAPTPAQPASGKSGN